MCGYSDSCVYHWELSGFHVALYRQIKLAPLAFMAADGKEIYQTKQNKQTKKQKKRKQHLERLEQG